MPIETLHGMSSDVIFAKGRTTVFGKSEVQLIEENSYEIRLAKLKLQHKSLKRGLSREHLNKNQSLLRERERSAEQT